MSNDPIPESDGQVRLRRTGTRRVSRAEEPLTPRPYAPRRRGGRGVYGGLIFVLVLVGFFLQSAWMQRVRERGAADIIPNTFAEKLTRWMLYKKGLAPAQTAPPEAPGAEQIPCGVCMGTGSMVEPDGSKGICTICQGVGFRMVRRFDAADRICPFCGGMGRVELPDTGVVGTCPRCDGRGLIRSRAEAESSPDRN